MTNHDSQGRFVVGHQPFSSGRPKGVCQFCGEKCGNRVTKSCHARRISYARTSRQKKIGWTVERMQEYVSLQEGRCAICEEEFTTLGREPHADHDHERNTPRGLLCRSCNLGLGNFGDDVGKLSAAIDYLLYWRWAKEEAE